MTGFIGLHDAVEAGAGGDAGHSAAAGDGSAVNLVNFGAEAERRRAADCLIDAEAVDGGAFVFDELADGFLVDAVGYEDVNVLEALGVQLCADFLDQSRGSRRRARPGC